MTVSTAVRADQGRQALGLATMAKLDPRGGDDTAALGDLGGYILEFGLGEIYSRSKLGLRDRELAAVAMLIAMGGREDQLRFHMAAALNVGLTVEELEEVIIQTAPFAGFPGAINAYPIFKDVVADFTSASAHARPTTRGTALGGGRTEQLLKLMKRGDDAFNARDFAAVDAVHDPDMVAYIAGSPQPIYGSVAHAAAMRQMLQSFPDLHVNTPYSTQFGSGDWITVVTNATGTFTREMIGPHGERIEPTGKAFDVEFGQTTKWEGERIIIISAFFDMALQARQLGLVEAAPELA